MCVAATPPPPDTLPKAASKLPLVKVTFPLLCLACSLKTHQLLVGVSVTESSSIPVLTEKLLTLVKLLPFPLESKPKFDVDELLEKLR